MTANPNLDSDPRMAIHETGTPTMNLVWRQLEPTDRDDKPIGLSSLSLRYWPKLEPTGYVLCQEWRSNTGKSEWRPIQTV